MNAVEITAVGPDDFESWAPLWVAYQEFYKVDIPESATQRIWPRFLHDIEPMHAALARVGRRAVGLVHWLYHRSTWTTGDYCYLQDLYVSEDARGAGIGRAMIEHVYADAKLHGAPRVYWTTHETNHTAMQLYDGIAERSPFIQYRKILP